eukprot:Sspe_Gene.57362::Locus_31479_Transcript_1_1_Confidence_1.000_Length_3433::g.57362::m.57362/K06560/MRC, CD206, CD280; mannose receptor, C type
MQTAYRAAVIAAFLACGAAKCPQSWVPLGDRCYKVSPSSGPWDQQACDPLQPGATLASFRTKTEHVDVSSALNLQSPAWVGVTRLEAFRSTWEWADGTPYTPLAGHSLWAASHPFGLHSCASIGGVGDPCEGLLCEASCDAQLPLLCELPAPCLVGWQPSPDGTRCFKTVIKAWSLDACDANAHLAKITSKDDLDFISTIVTGQAFVGLNKLRESKKGWEWVNGNPDQSLWFGGEPDHDRCAYINGPCDWDHCDHPCTLAKQHLCDTPLTLPLLCGGFVKNNRCYRLTLAKAAWDGGELCKAEYGGGSELAVLDTKELLELGNRNFKAPVLNPDGNWIGLSKLPYSRRQWAWADGSAATFDWLWHPSQPSGDGSCGFLREGEHSEGACETKRSVLCMSTKSAGACPGHHDGSRCYEVAPNPEPWSRTICPDAIPGSTMASFADQATQEAVGRKYTMELWTGLNRLGANTGWEWVDGTPESLTAWAQGHPTALHFCGAINGKDGVASENCSDHLPSICQYPANPTPAPPTPSPTPSPTTAPTSLPSPPPSLPPPPPPPPPPQPQPSPNPPQGEPPPVPSPSPTITAVVAATASPEVLPGKEVLESVNTIVGVGSGAAGLISPSGAAHATRLALVMSMKCDPKTDWSNLNRLLHPSGIEVEGNKAAGAVLSNMGCILGFYVLHCALCAVLPLSPRFKSFLAAQGLLRFPSAGLVVFLFLYQGTAFSSIRLVLFGHKPELILIGLFGTIVCIAIPIATAYKVYSSVPRSCRYCIYQSLNLSPKGRFREDKDWRLPKWVLFVIGKGEWVSVERESKWDDRYTTVLRPFKETCAWCGTLIQFSSMFALSITNSPPTPTMTECGHVRLASACVFLLVFATEAYLLPFARARDQFLEPMMNLFQGVALFFMSFGFYLHDREHWTFPAASYLLMGSMVLLYVKLTLDILTELFILIKGRRDRLQENEWEEIEARRLLQNDDVPMEMIPVSLPDTPDSTASKDQPTNSLPSSPVFPTPGREMSDLNPQTNALRVVHTAPALRPFTMSTPNTTNNGSMSSVSVLSAPGSALLPTICPLATTSSLRTSTDKLSCPSTSLPPSITSRHPKVIAL